MSAKFSDRMMASFQSPSLVESMLASQKQTEAFIKGMEANFASSVMKSVIESENQFADIGKSMASLSPDSMKPMLAFQKQMKSFSKSMASLAAAKQFNKQSVLLSRSFKSISQQFQQEVDDIKKFQAIDIQPLFKTFDLVHEMLEPSIRAIASISKLGASYKTDISNLQNITKDFALNVRHLDFIESYVDIQDRYNRACEAAAPNPLEVVIAEIEEQELKAPKSALSRKYYIFRRMDVLMFIVNILFQMYLNNASENRTKEYIKSKIEVSEQNVIHEVNGLKETVLSLTKRIEEFVSRKNEDIFYVLGTKVRLRAEPITESEILSLLYPNLEVRMIEEKPEWIKIEYFDYLENVHKSGWAFKRYLKKIDHKLPNK